MKFAKKCLQFILKLQQRLILSVQRGNAKFNIHSENTLFQIVKNKKFGILCKYSAQLLFRMVTKDPTRWKSRWMRNSRKMQKPLQILFSSCLFFQIARTTDTESTTSPKGDSTSYLRNVQTSNHSYYWEGLRPKITPRPKPYSDRTAIKFTSKVDFNLLGSPFRYLERSQNLGEHDSELIGGKQMIFPARFCGRNQQFPVFTCQNLDNLELN